MKLPANLTLFKQYDACNNRNTIYDGNTRKYLRRPYTTITNMEQPAENHVLFSKIYVYGHVLDVYLGSWKFTLYFCLVRECTQRVFLTKAYTCDVTSMILYDLFRKHSFWRTLGYSDTWRHVIPYGPFLSLDFDTWSEYFTIPGFVGGWSL